MRGGGTGRSDARWLVVGLILGCWALAAVASSATGGHAIALWAAAVASGVGAVAADRSAGRSQAGRMTLFIVVVGVCVARAAAEDYWWLLAIGAATGLAISFAEDAWQRRRAQPRSLRAGR